MSVSNQFIPIAPSASNFHNLALFICHLLIDGRFKVGHIIYDPMVFDNQAIIEIGTICPSSIPWLMTDVTKLISSSWTPSRSSDHILQLIFLNPAQFPNEMEGFAFHRLFIFSNVNQNDSNHQIDAMEKSNVIPDNTFPILHYNLSNGLFSMIRSLDENGSVILNDISRDWFSVIFGDYEKSCVFIIRYTTSFPSNCSSEKSKFLSIWNGNIFFANYLLSSLNASYINRTYYHYGPSKLTWEHQIIRRKSLRIYQDLTEDYNIIGNEMLLNLTNNRSNILSMDMHVMPANSKLESTKHQISLYPYHSDQLSVLFFYGQDDQRKVSSNIISRLKIFLLNWTNMFVMLAAVVLCFIRRLRRLRRDGFISVLIDVTVIFTGGGRLRMDHKLERWFFVIMSIGALFLNAICLGPTLFPSYLHREQNVDTFQQLAEINPPIYIPISLRKSENIITEMLRNKLGSEFQYAGISFLLEVFQKQNNAFAYIVVDTNLYQAKIFSDGVRDYDLLKEKLGSLRWAYSLDSNHRVPERMTHKIDKTISAMMENGLHNFFIRSTAYLEKLRARYLLLADKDDFRALTMDDLKSPMIFCCYLLGIVWLVFLAEIIIHRLKIRYARNS